MRFTANLALQARENRRRVWIVWGGLFALAFAVLLVLAVDITVNWQAAAAVRRRSAAVEAELPGLVAQRAALVSALERPGMRDQWDRARHLNGLIDRKAVSWTRLFERLEALMPAEVQLLSIGPGRGGQDIQNEVTITIAAPSIPAALPFVQKLEDAADFAAPQVRAVADRQAQSQTPGAPVRLQITAQYHPRLGPASYFGASGAAANPAAAAGRAR